MISQCAMPFRSWLVVALLPLAFAARDCAFQPILKGVSTKQSLGETQKRLYTSEADCKQRCLAETQLNCTAFLWGGSSSSDCYLLDKVDLQRQIFVDQRAYLLYVEVCDGEPVPSIGYCQFLLNKTNVAFTTEGKRVSPGFTTESSCREFCIANYWGQNCDAFIVSPERASECSLYPTAPSDLAVGSQNLWTKNCFPPPVNCEYSPWSMWTDCSKSCGGGQRTRTREIVKEGSDNGVPCMENEKTQTGVCAVEECGAVCQYKEWSAFGPCNATCSENGVRSRSRSLVAAAGGCTQEQLDHKECASTTECGKTCIYSSWSEWSPCDANCMSTRSRSLEVGEAQTCEIEYGPLENSIVCEGGACGASSLTTTKPEGSFDPGAKTTTTATVTGGGSVPESGCKIPSVDPSSRSSSVGYKAVGVRPDCAAMCRQETNFPCGGYTTTGPGGPCVLHGRIDRQVITLANSRYYLQDINCNNANGSSGKEVCSWKLVSSGGDPSFSAPHGFVSIGLTIDANHCGTLCMMNHPIFRPNGCMAYAWNPNIPFESSRDNCFMYNWDAHSNSSSSGPFELFHLDCSSSSSSV